MQSLKLTSIMHGIWKEKGTRINEITQNLYVLKGNCQEAASGSSNKPGIKKGVT